MEELKPCPFCGGEATFHEYTAAAIENARRNGLVVPAMAECGRCGAMVSFDDGRYPTRERLAEAWNRRAERTCLAKPYEVDGETGFYDCIECECGEVNDVSARYCNGCGGLIEVVYE